MISDLECLKIQHGSNFFSESEFSLFSSIKKKDNSRDDEYIQEINMGLVGQKVLPHDILAPEIKKFEKSSKRKDELWK